MPSHAHEQAIRFIQADPTLLLELLRRLTGKAAPGPLTRLDSALRGSEPLEVWPDLVFTRTGGWLALEVQLDIDQAKARQWLLMATLLTHAHGPGSLVVLTPSAAVASWALGVARWQSPEGCALTLVPVVLHLDEGTAKQLLDPARPALGFFAAWAMQSRHGDRALDVVERAIRLVDHLPAELQRPPAPRHPERAR